MDAPSGRQFEITNGAQRATVVEVGGGVREYDVDGRPVLDPYPRDAMVDGAHGAPLVPWPNRLDGGRYRFDGVEHQVPINEPPTNTAIHGLLRWRAWQPLEHAADRVVMGVRLHPMSGYPFTLDVRVEYRLGDTGLVVTTTATNAGRDACPYGHGQHPYLSPGSGLVDACVLELDAATRVVVDAERMLPVGREAVAGTRYDFCGGARIDDAVIDAAYTDLARDADGRTWALLTGPDGATVAFWVDSNYPFVQLFTGDTLAPGRQRRGLACEPTTCPPNAFATGEHLIRLPPGGSHAASWGVGLR